MEKKLTQEEIDTVFRAAQGHGADESSSSAALTGAPGSPPAADQRELTTCNFRQSARISREQLRSVSQLREIFARNLTHSLGA